MKNLWELIKESRGYKAMVQELTKALEIKKNYPELYNLTVTEVISTGYICLLMSILFGYIAVDFYRRSNLPECTDRYGSLTGTGHVLRLFAIFGAVGFFVCMYQGLYHIFNRELLALLKLV